MTRPLLVPCVVRLAEWRPRNGGRAEGEIPLEIPATVGQGPLEVAAYATIDADSRRRGRRETMCPTSLPATRGPSLVRVASAASLGRDALGGTADIPRRHTSLPPYRARPL